jgi:hypothetical protein
MELIGTIARLQVQRSSLKLGERPRRWYDPAPLLAVPSLSLDEFGVVGQVPEGTPVIDVHNRKHPASRHGSGNGISLGFTSHYAQMRRRFGEHIVDGIAGENIIVQTNLVFCAADLAKVIVVETASGPVTLEGVRVIEPCVEFSRYALGYRGQPGHDLATPAEHDAATLEAREVAGPAGPDGSGRPDPAVKATLVFLRRGMRGYCATYTHGATVVRAGDRVFSA